MLACPRSAALTLCLITDRRRLLAAVGEPLSSWSAVLLSQVEGAVRGGVDVVLIRERDADAGELARFVKECVSIVAGTAARVVVNDRADVAVAAAAHGVHLREASMPIDAARRLLDHGCIIGRSVHDAEGAAASATADYLIAGHVFESVSKLGEPVGLGLSGLSAVVDAASGRPVWAVGGVTADRIPEIVEHGASGVAAIGAFIAATRREDLAHAAQAAAQALRFSFDSSTRFF